MIRTEIPQMCDLRRHEALDASGYVPPGGRSEQRERAVHARVAEQMSGGIWTFVGDQLVRAKRTAEAK